MRDLTTRVHTPELLPEYAAQQADFERFLFYLGAERLYAFREQIG